MKKRVSIPTRNAQQLLELAKKLRTRHQADGDASPLKVLDWITINTLIDEAAQTDELALSLKREKLRVYSQRARQMQSVLSLVRSTRDLLTAVYPGQMKELGRWGFDVLDSKVTLPEPGEDDKTKA